MKYFLRRSVLLAGLAVVALTVMAPTAHAQARARSLRAFPVRARPFPAAFAASPAAFRPFPAYGYGRAFPVVQNFSPAFVPTQLQRDALRNWSFQTRVIGRTYGSLPPWLFGYNPYNYGYYGYSGYNWYPPVPPVPPVPPAYPAFPASPAYPTYSNPYAFYAPPVGPASIPLYSGVVNPYAAY
jgi:hypothetical protein